MLHQKFMGFFFPLSGLCLAQYCLVGDNFALRICNWRVEIRRMIRHPYLVLDFIDK